MSAHLHYEIVRNRQHEIEARAMRARHLHDLSASPGRSRRSMKIRIGRAFGAAVVAIGTAFAPDASANASH